MAASTVARPIRMDMLTLTTLPASFFSGYILGAIRFTKKIIINPITRPIMFDVKIKNALKATSNDPVPIPISVTAAGGINAAAIATPTIISGMAVIIASPPATPSKTATTIPTGCSSVLDCISGVISIGVATYNANVIAAANNDETRFAEKNSGPLISFILPKAEFNAIEEKGPIRGDISIAPIITATMLDIEPTRATTVAIRTIM